MNGFLALTRSNQGSIFIPYENKNKKRFSDVFRWYGYETLASDWLR